MSQSWDPWNRRTTLGASQNHPSPMQVLCCRNQQPVTCNLLLRSSGKHLRISAWSQHSFPCKSPPPCAHSRFNAVVVLCAPRRKKVHVISSTTIVFERCRKYTWNILRQELILKFVAHLQFDLCYRPNSKLCDNILSMACVVVPSPTTNTGRWCSKRFCMSSGQSGIVVCFISYAESAAS